MDPGVVSNSGIIVEYSNMISHSMEEYRVNHKLSTEKNSEVALFLWFQMSCATVLALHCTALLTY
jgi:hypothetical protein